MLFKKIKTWCSRFFEHAKVTGEAGANVRGCEQFPIELLNLAQYLSMTRKMLSIQEAAEFMGVAAQTLRRWERVPDERTPGGRRRPALAVRSYRGSAQSTQVKDFDAIKS
jgi:hypothetical protein